MDGLSDLVLKAAVDPDGPAAEQLPFPDLFREAHRDTRSVLGRKVLLPNLTFYFFDQGTRLAAVYSGTAALSTPSWAVIDTGQPSIIKNQFLFNRATGTLARFLDQFQETRRLIRGAGKTSALWSLDLAGVPPLIDAFAPGRVWTSLQFIVRDAPLEQLAALGRHVATGGTGSYRPSALIPTHVRQTVYGPDVTEQSERALAQLAARVILRVNEAGEEQYDLISLIFPSLDRQFHVNPDYRNILAWMVQLDGWVGTVLAAVETSRRREETLVALLSDHGLDFDPLHLHYAVPITSWFREAAWGGHTNLSPTVENFAQDWRVPARGLDFASRINESRHSPYGTAVPHGEKGYYTAFLANEGNPRFDAYLRHSDLNRLHLLLLDTLRVRREPERLANLFPVFRSALRDLSPWAEEEVARFHEQIRAFEQYWSHLMARGDGYALDSADRIRQEIEAAGKVVRSLERVLKLPGEEEEAWTRWARAGFRIADFIPKGYLGIPNDVATLHEYIAGWQEPPGERWFGGPAPFRRVNYPELISELRAANPNSRGGHHPFDFFAAHLPVGSLDPAPARPLRQAIWLRFSQGRGQAVLLESADGLVQYMPIRPLDWRGPSYRIEPAADVDPLSYGALRFEWLTRHEWAEQTGSLTMAGVPMILTDMFRDNHRDFLLSPAHRERIAKQDGLDPDGHVRAVDRLFRQMVPDFRAWNHSGWNVNTRSHTPGGSHGGFTPLENRIVFALWGGGTFGLPRGRAIPGAHLSQDVVPTLLDLMGMLDGEGRAENFPGFAGHAIPIRDVDRPER